ncbi:MAG: hypothetical protein K6G88_06370 [Lachnospiraceae bacterium]|nr:hypothetical protein [Lachnospiraceae bacterium]
MNRGWGNKWAGPILLICGLIILGYKFYGFSNGVEVQAVISNIKPGRHDKYYVDYYYNGVYYKGKNVVDGNITWDRGQNITVIIDPNNPANCYGTNSLVIPILIVCVGAVFTYLDFIKRS